MSVLTKDQIVEVFSRPLSKEDSEGEARLIEFQFDNGESEYWTVAFIVDGFECDRFISKD